MTILPYEINVVGQLPPRAKFDELPYEAWLRLREGCAKLDAMGWVYLFETLDRLTTGKENAVSIGLGAALAEVDAVIGFSQLKHPDKAWRNYSATQHVGKAQRHSGAGLYGEPYDGDSKRLHLAHAAARLLMATQLEIEENLKR